MISHSTAEHHSNAANPTDSFTWTFPGSPVRINIRFGLISRLQTELNRRVEMGGVLLGHKGNAPDTVEIRDCICIPCENQLDGLYTLKVSELERLRQTDSGLEELRAHGSGLFCNWYPGLSVVGYFRTQSKDVLRLRDAEIELVRKRFPDPNSVVLLIETSRDENEAGFFFPNSSVPVSFLNFPFDAAVLQGGAKPDLIEPVAPPSEEAEEVPPESEIAVKGGYRGSLGLRTRLAANAVLRTLAGLRTLWAVFSLQTRSAASAVLRTLAGLRARCVAFSLRTQLAVKAVLRKLAGLRTLWAVFSLQTRSAASAVLRTLAGLRARWVSFSLRTQLAVKAVLRKLAGLRTRWMPSSDSAPYRNLLATAGAVLVLTALGAILLPKYGMPTWHRFSTSSLTFLRDIVDSTGSILASSSPNPVGASRTASPVGASRSATRQRRPAGFKFPPPHANQVRTGSEHMVLRGPDPPQTVPNASEKVPSVPLLASRNGAESDPRSTLPDRVEPVVTIAVPAAVPSPDQISIGAERRDITEKFGDPALSVETMVRGHFIETMVYGPNRAHAHAQTIISLEDGKVFSASSK